MDESLPDLEARDYGESLDVECRALQADVPIDRLVAELDALSGAAASALRPAPAVRLVESATARYGALATGAYGKLLVSKLVGDASSRIRRIPLPESIRAEYPATLARIARGLRGVSHASYVGEHGDFWRDLRLSAQLSVPLTASRVLDRISFLPRTFYRNMGLAEDLRCLGRVAFRLRGLGPVFRVHIDERDMSDFDDAGCERAYLRAAEMLQLYPGVKGAVGTSWTHDPQLDRISPRLTFPRRMQLAHGAFLRREGPSEETTERALRKSATRRGFYERGEYVPVGYTIVWPRRGMLRWAAGIAPAARDRPPAAGRAPPGGMG